MIIILAVDLIASDDHRCLLGLPFSSLLNIYRFELRLYSHGRQWLESSSAKTRDVLQEIVAHVTTEHTYNPYSRFRHTNAKKSSNPENPNNQFTPQYAHSKSVHGLQTSKSGEDAEGQRAELIVE